MAFAVAGLLMIFPALIEHFVADFVPYPHFIGLAVAVLLLVLQRPRQVQRA